MKRIAIVLIVAMVLLAGCMDNTVSPDVKDDYTLEIDFSGESWTHGRVHYKNGETPLWIRGKIGRVEYEIEDVDRIDLTVQKNIYDVESDYWNGDTATATLYDYAGDVVEAKDFTTESVEFTNDL